VKGDLEVLIRTARSVLHCENYPRPRFPGYRYPDISIRSLSKDYDLDPDDLNQMVELLRKFDQGSG
jgi:hypothetical protein